MGLKERVQELCKRKGVTSQQAEIDLGFAKGSISKLNANLPTSKKLQKMAEYFNITVDYLMNGETDSKQGYYFNDETAAIAQEIFENKELRMLFDASKDATPDDLKTVRDMMLALKRKERGETD